MLSVWSESLSFKMLLKHEIGMVFFNGELKGALGF